jgi:hypothetical protein
MAALTGSGDPPMAGLPHGVRKTLPTELASVQAEALSDFANWKVHALTQFRQAD